MKADASLLNSAIRTSMPREARNDVPRYFYHVIVRCINVMSSLRSHLLVHRPPRIEHIFPLPKSEDMTDKPSSPDFFGLLLGEVLNRGTLFKNKEEVTSLEGSALERESGKRGRQADRNNKRISVMSPTPCFYWSRRSDLNRGPADYEVTAQPYRNLSRSPHFVSLSNDVSFRKLRNVRC